MARSLVTVLIFVCMAAEALACRGETFERTIISDEVPVTLDAPVAVEATIIDKSEITDPETKAGWIVMNAQIDRVIKGAVGTSTLKIVTQGSDCTVGFGAGSHGIIVGTLRRDAHGTLELVAIQESKADRAIRKNRERGK